MPLKPNTRSNAVQGAEFVRAIALPAHGKATPDKSPTSPTTKHDDMTPIVADENQASNLPQIIEDAPQPWQSDGLTPPRGWGRR
jgi:hypothetical protein